MAAIGGLGYEITRADGVCAATGETLRPGDPIVVTLIEREDEGVLQRLEYKLDAWDASAGTKAPTGVFASWRTVRPDPSAKPDPLIDAGSLMELFESLGGAEDTRRQVFRYVLALLLIRKKKLEYLGAADGVLRVRERGPKDAPSETQHVVNPGMDDDAVAAAIEQLSQVMSGSEA
ncbi:MAG: hypothetical protein AAGK04_07575 [Planctomycetota bacterium]